MKYQSYSNADISVMWKKVKLGNLLQVKSSKRVLESEWKSEGVPFFRGREITKLSKDGVVNNNLFISVEHFESLSEKYGIPNAGDIMITAIGTIGNTYIVQKGDRFYFKDASVLWLHKQKDVNTKYINYWFKSASFFSQLDKGNGATVDTLTIKKLESVFLLIPRLVEQVNITKFLDRETSRIDSLIKEKENFIALLKEKRQALISHAVTKGLDPTVKMKDSSVEWIGDVPEQWNVTSIKYIAELGPKKENIESSLKCSFVPMKKLRTDSILLDEHRLVADVEDGYTFFKDEDILMAKVTPCFENKNIAVAKKLTNKIGFGSSEIYVFRMVKKNSNRYLYYRLQEDKFMSIAKSSMTGTAGLKRVPADMINNFTIAVPSTDEQKIIANSLDKKTSKIGLLVKETQNSIELLKEHRTVLISAAVTGKIDVRNFDKEVA